MLRSGKTRGLLLLACAALALRVLVVGLLWADPKGPVTYEHGEIAENLLAGRGFTVRYLGATGPTSQQAPLFPVLVAAAYKLFGVGSPAAILAIQLVQCVAGAGVMLAVVWLAWSLVPDQPNVGWIAGIGAAVYPPHLYMVTHVQVAVWAALVLTLALAAAVAPSLRGRMAGAAVVGFLCGVLLLIEPIFAVATPIFAITFAQWRLRQDDARAGAGRYARAIAGMTVMAAVALLTVSPWLVRNYRVHGEFVFIKSSFGYAFWQGNNPHSWGTDKIPKPSARAMAAADAASLAEANRNLWEARHETLYIDDVLLTDEDMAKLGALSEPQRSRVLLKRAVAFIKEQPAQYARLCVQRLRYFLLFDDTNPKTSHPVYRIATVAWLATFVLGIAVGRRDWRLAWPTLAIFAVVTLFHVLTITSARFRMPLEPITFLWCAVAVRAAWHHSIGMAFFGRAVGRDIPVERRPSTSATPLSVRTKHARRSIFK